MPTGEFLRLQVNFLEKARLTVGLLSGGPGRDWTVVSWHGETGALCVRHASH